MCSAIIGSIISMVKNRDAKTFKLKERQKKIAGKFPFHRVHKLRKILDRLFRRKKMI